LDLLGMTAVGAAAFEKRAQMIGVISLVADQPGAGRSVAEQRRRDVDVGDVAAGQAEGERPAPAVDGGVDFGRAPTARAADGLLLLPPFAPLAARCARTAVLSIITTSGGSAQAVSASKIRCHRPRLLHRLYRLNTVVYGPYSSGSARHQQPSRRRWRMPLMMRRGRPGGPAPDAPSAGTARSPSIAPRSARNCPP
jgi:hypothetical protein